MKTLLVMRHAKSSWADGNLGDHERPLNGRGKDDAPRMGKLLRGEGLVPDVVISSTAKRARQTAVLTAEAADYEGEIVTTDELYLAEGETYTAVLRELADPHDCVLIVGHNPGISDFLSEVGGRFVQMTTANVGQVRLDIATWGELEDGVTGELVNFWQPKQL